MQEIQNTIEIERPEETIFEVPKQKSKAPIVASVIAILVSVVAVFRLTFVGEFLYEKTKDGLGLLAFAVYGLIVYLAILTLVNKKVHTLIKRKIVGVILILAGLIILFGESNFAGSFGKTIAHTLVELITYFGTAFLGIGFLFFGASIILFDNWTLLLRKMWSKWTDRNKVKVQKVEQEIIKPSFDKKVFVTEKDKLSARRAALNADVKSDLEFIQNQPSVNDRIIFKGSVKNAFFLDEDHSDEQVCLQSDAFAFAAHALNDKTSYDHLPEKKEIQEKPALKEYCLNIRPHGFVKQVEQIDEEDEVEEVQVMASNTEEHMNINQNFEDEYDDLPFDIEPTNNEFAKLSQPEPVVVSPVYKTEEVSYVSQRQTNAPMKNVVVKHGYKRPSIDMLKEPVKSSTSEENAIHANLMKGVLEQALNNFGVVSHVENITVGPSVTRYELVVNAGTKVSKVVNLQDDIKMALAAKDIRIEAPIPGKSAIGIEVPNKASTMVSFREVFEKAPKDKQDSKLLVALGKDISGAPVFAELNKMPHMLVAGATGSGKSVCISTILTSLVMRARPDEVRLLLIDPKMVELSMFDGIPHLLCPVITNPKTAAVALKNLVEEMERRYMVFSESHTRSIETYNELAQEKGREKMPFIVAVIDELADLMMVAGKEVEESIVRITQKARAAGIHLVVATQRPSVDVITGLIKANIPSRIAFAVSSQVDSRTILDSIGAEMLLGKGDALFAPIGQNSPTRIQGAFVSESEIQKVIYHVKSEMAPQYADEMINIKASSNQQGSLEIDEQDELFDDVIEFVKEQGRASTSMIQRKFGIGYNRAARMIDIMEEEQIIGPANGSKPREVLI